MIFPTCAASTSALSTLMMGLEIWTGDIFALNSGRRTWHPNKPGYQQLDAAKPTQISAASAKKSFIASPGGNSP